VLYSVVFFDLRWYLFIVCFFAVNLPPPALLWPRLDIFLVIVLEAPMNVLVEDLVFQYPMI
jgi:hypothetical protein